MVSDPEPAKILLPYVRRADELQNYEPLVSYYCRLYALNRGVKIPKRERTKTTNTLLLSLIKQLEKDKKSVQLNSDDGLYVEGFAIKLFMKADKQERRGKANMTTAKTFYAASLFFEILHNFGDVPFDLEQKQKYAAWKAAEIHKALKKTQKPFGGFSESELPSQKLAADSHEPRISINQSPDTGLEIDATNQSCKKLSDPMPILNIQNGSTVSTSNCNHQDLSDDDQSFHDCSEELDHDVLFSDATGSWLDDTISLLNYTITGPADVQDQEYHHEITGHDVLFPNDAGSRVDPTICALNDGGSRVDPTICAPNDGADEADHDVLHSTDTGSELDCKVSVMADVQGEQSQPSAAEIVDHGVLSNDIGRDNTCSIPANVQGQHYQPSPAEIVKALKASRLAVTALASDNVPSAVSYIKQALDLLTAQI